MNRCLGVDLGTKSMGLAISDSLGIVHGYENFIFLEGAYKQAKSHLLEVCQKESIKEIALGYPLNMDGSEGERALSSVRFKKDLEELDPSLMITLVDERLTTVMANRRLLEADISRAKRKKVIDQQSAVTILESYLSRKEYEHGN